MGQTVKGKAIVLRLAIGFLSPGIVFAADQVQTAPAANTDKAIGFDIAIGTELMSGDTTYSMGNPITFPDGRSEPGFFPWRELEWPLDIWLARVDAGLNIGSSWRINGILKKNISDPDDNMIHKDWSYPGKQLDIYSESNISDFDALIWDIDVEWVFLQRQSWSLYAGLGYQHQKFEYDGQLIHQYSPSGNPNLELYGNGSVDITYDMTYQMPYFLVGTDFQITSNFIITGSLSYSPWVDAEDENHTLILGEPIVGYKGDMDGYAYMIDVAGTYYFVSSWFLEMGFHYTKIDVDGNQNVSFYGVHELTEYEESESAQTSGYLKIGYSF